MVTEESNRFRLQGTKNKPKMLAFGTVFTRAATQTVAVTTIVYYLEALSNTHGDNDSNNKMVYIYQFNIPIRLQ